MRTQLTKIGDSNMFQSTQLDYKYNIQSEAQSTPIHDIRRSFKSWFNKSRRLRNSKNLSLGWNRMMNPELLIKNAALVQFT